MLRPCKIIFISQKKILSCFHLSRVIVTSHIYYTEPYILYVFIFLVAPPEGETPLRKISTHTFVNTEVGGNND